MKKLVYVALGFLVLGLTACGNEGNTETDKETTEATPGQKLDSALEASEKKAEEAGKDLREAAGEIKENLENAADKTKNALENAAEKTKMQPIRQ